MVACKGPKDVCDGNIVSIKFLRGMKICEICKSFLPQKFCAMWYIEIETKIFARIMFSNYCMGIKFCELKIFIEAKFMGLEC